MRTLSSTLLYAQDYGYPAVGTIQPAVRCILTSKDGGTTYDYSFNPTVTTNRLSHIQQIEERETDSGVILLSNHDRAVPSDLTGYYVDVGWGANTSSGVKYAEADNCVSPRLWTLNQKSTSGGNKGQTPQKYTVLTMGGVWTAVLDKQPLRVGIIPNYTDENGALTDMTIYEVLKYLIETSLSAQTGLTFTLDALVQDDSLISTIKPYPAPTPPEEDVTPLIPMNEESPESFETYGNYIRRLMSYTKSFLKPKPGLAFEIIYPQSTDSIVQNYYSDKSHHFYRAENDTVQVPNHVEIFGGLDAKTVGDWYDPDHYTTTTAGSFVVGRTYWIVTIGTTDFTLIGASSNTVGLQFTATGAGSGTGTANYYSGAFMPVLYSAGWNSELSTEQAADDAAETEGLKIKDRVSQGIIVLPMDAGIELYDRIMTIDSRGN